MSCSQCDKVANASPYAGMHFTADPSIKHVTGRDGRRYAVDSCLVAKTRRPRGGWGVTLIVNKQTVTVDGSTSDEVFNKVKSTLKINDFDVSDHNIWINLNIQWLDKVVDKHQKVTLSMLLEIVAPNPNQKPSDKVIKASDWFKRVFGILELYLAQNIYEYKSFLSLVQTARSISNPNSSNLIGNSDIYIILNMEANNLELNPIYGQVEARQWLVDIRNRIGKQSGLPDVTFEQYSQQN